MSPAGGYHLLRPVLTQWVYRTASQPALGSTLVLVPYPLYPCAKIQSTSASSSSFGSTDTATVVLVSYPLLPSNTSNLQSTLSSSLLPEPMWGGRRSRPHVVETDRQRSDEDGSTDAADGHVEHNTRVRLGLVLRGYSKTTPLLTQLPFLLHDFPISVPSQTDDTATLD